MTRPLDNLTCWCLTCYSADAGSGSAAVLERVSRAQRIALNTKITPPTALSRRLKVLETTVAARARPVIKGSGDAAGW